MATNINILTARSALPVPPSSPRPPFDPSAHLCFVPPQQTLSMTDIHLPLDTGISPLAVSHPFPLFTPSAVARLREEILSDEVLASSAYSSNIAPAQLRGYAARHAPFVYDAWTHPETIRAVSEVAGVGLSLQMELEIGHVNLSFPPSNTTTSSSGTATTSEGNMKKDEKPTEAETGIKTGTEGEKEKEIPIVGWHRDSYPFVCVVMLSDCSNMVGGETVLKMGNGETVKIKSPELGHAIVLQGRYITHQALRAAGTATERITMVTSFRPRDPLERDDTVLKTVRPISDLSELYFQFAKYRLEILEDRIRHQLRQMAEAKMAGKNIPTGKLKAFLEEQERFLAHTNQEIVRDEDVVKGILEAH